MSKENQLKAQAQAVLDNYEYGRVPKENQMILFRVQNERVYNFILSNLKWFDKKIWMLVFKYKRRRKISAFLYNLFLKKKIKFHNFESIYSPKHGLSIESIGFYGNDQITIDIPFIGSSEYINEHLKLEQHYYENK